MITYNTCIATFSAPFSFSVMEIMHAINFKVCFMFYIFFCFSAYSIFYTPLAALRVICGGFVETVLKFRSNCGTFDMPNNSICPLQPGDFFNTCQNKADCPEVTVSVSLHFVNAPWLSEFLRRREVNSCRRSLPQISYHQVSGHISDGVNI